MSLRSPRKEMVRGVWDAEADWLLDRLRPQVRDVFFVDLAPLDYPDVLEFLRWVVPQLEGSGWESLLLEVDAGTPIATGLTRPGQRVVSLAYRKRQSWD